MANTTSNVTVGKPKVGGAIFYAPVGSTLPTDATTALDAAFTGVGYISEDGFTNSITIESETIKDWGGENVLVVQTSKEETYQFTMLEALNPDVLKVVYGDDNVTGTLANGITVRSNAADLEAHAWVIDTIETDGAVVRHVIPNASVSEIGDVQYVGNAPVSYEITLTAMKGDSAFGYDTSKKNILRA